jgi:enoyl-CoA hydratase/carnithine racemase
MPTRRPLVGRRSLLKKAATAAGAMAVAAAGATPNAQAQTQAQATPVPPQVQPPALPTPQLHLEDVPLGPDVTLTVERRGEVVLLGFNRPAIQNRLDPATRARLGAALYQYEHDPSLRAAVLFGHGPHFSRGIDVDASQAGLISGQREATPPPSAQLELNGAAGRHLTKPVVCVVHGDTWNLGHELYLSCDIRVAASNTNFGQDENTHGRFPGGGATVRFVREAGWGNAMRYMLTGDHWTADESHRMGITQAVAPTPEAALATGLALAEKIAACGPLSIRTTLISAREVVDPVESDALSKLGARYAALYRTEDFIEGRKAEAEGRPPRYQGK